MPSDTVVGLLLVLVQVSMSKNTMQSGLHYDNL